MTNTDFIKEDGSIVLDSEKNLALLLAAVLRGDIVFEEPLTFAKDLEESFSDTTKFTFEEEPFQAAECLGLFDAEEESLVTEEESELITPKEERVTVTEAEHFLRATYKTYPKSRMDIVNNKFIEIYDILDEAYNMACLGHVDLHGEEVFDMSTVFLHNEVTSAKDAITIAKMLVTKALTNELITK